MAGDRQSGLWVPAQTLTHQNQYGDEGEDEMEEEDHQHRGRQEEQIEA